MLRYLSRVSLWLAALAAAASLFTPGREGATLATVAMIALIGALVLRRFMLKNRIQVVIEAEPTRVLGEAAMLEVATMLTRRITDANGLAEALEETREELVHELGARGVIVHGPVDAATPLVMAERFPLGDAFVRREVCGNAVAGYALPVERDERVVAVLELKGVELEVEPPALLRLLELLKVQLDGIARRDGHGGRQDPPPCQLRRADRAAQPPAAHLAH